MQDKIKQLLQDIRKGKIKSIAKAITIVENEIKGHDELLFALNNNSTTKLIGVTGPPGAGKSTLVNALLEYWTQQNKKIAVVAVDPSSPFNYGALLGDRVRMRNFYDNPNVYIRSLASRGALGGLSAKVIEITDVLKNADFDYIIVETVGVGQSEVEIAALADCTVVALVPEAGDEVQTIKSGIMEIADIFVVNKADRASADTLFIHLKRMVHEKAAGEREIPVLKTIANTSEGIDKLASGIEQLLSLEDKNTFKKARLLTEKAWKIIMRQRMKDIDKQQLFEQLSANLNHATFNLYKFASSYQNI